MELILFLMMLSVFVGVGGFIMQNKNQSVFLGMAIALLGALFGPIWGIVAVVGLLFWPAAVSEPRVYTSSYGNGSQIDEDLDDIIVINPVVEKETVNAGKRLCSSCSAPIKHQKAKFCTVCGQSL